MKKAICIISLTALGMIIIYAQGVSGPGTTCTSNPDGCGAAAGLGFEPAGNDCQHLDGLPSWAKVCLTIPDPHSTCNPNGPSVSVTVHGGTCVVDGSGNHCESNDEGTLTTLSTCN